MHHFVDASSLDEANAAESMREIPIVNRGDRGDVTVRSLGDGRRHTGESLSALSLTS
jgi:hypothetical protein